MTQRKPSATELPQGNNQRDDGEGAGPSGPFSPSNRGQPPEGRQPFRTSLLNMIGLALFDALAFYIMWGLVMNDRETAAIVVLFFTILINIIFLSDRLYPIRWLAPGLVLLILMVVYPLFYTVFIAFTNYSDGHLLSKDQVIAQATRRYFQPDYAVNYQMDVYRDPGSGQFLLLLEDPQGNFFTATPEDGVLPFQFEGDPPQEINGYQFIPNLARFQFLSQLERLQIQTNDVLINVTGASTAQQAVRRFTYNAGEDSITDRQTGISYTPVRGRFVDEDGRPLPGVPGFTTVIGFENFMRVFTDRSIQRPFFSVFLWTVTFAAGTVLLNFSLGLIFAMVLNDRHIPLRSLWRSLIIIPYTIPGFISVLVWVGLLNPLYGPFNIMLRELFGVSPPWFSNGTLTRIAILGINLWLGYPYMMIITLGALQGIPTDMYEAADLDGAGPWARFRHLTLPLLLISVGPLLVGAFAFNFNNFTVIELVNEGGPPIPGSTSPAGQTDILISYTYRLAFAAGRGADFGMASTIALIIFIMIAAITAVNFRFTRQLEEVMR
jgi:maltose/maltodextrin transport system permease protein